MFSTDKSRSSRRTPRQRDASSAWVVLCFFETAGGDATAGGGEIQRQIYVETGC